MSRGPQAVVMSMAEEKVKEGEFIINQGEEGNFFYVVDTGELPSVTL